MRREIGLAATRKTVAFPEASSGTPGNLPMLTGGDTVSAQPAEILDRVEDARTMRSRRWDEMLQTLRKRLDSLQEGTADWERWKDYFGLLGAALNHFVETGQDFEAVWRVVKSGYVQVLIESDPESKNLRMPTQEEWDQLPEALPEMRRRYKIPE
jgi:hypothetical protein